MKLFGAYHDRPWREESLQYITCYDRVLEDSEMIAILECWNIRNLGIELFEVLFL